jgi:hypothetical protein
MGIIEGLIRARSTEGQGRYAAGWEEEWPTGLRLCVWIARACLIFAFFRAWWVCSLGAPEWVLFRFGWFSILYFLVLILKTKIKAGSCPAPDTPPPVGPASCSPGSNWSGSGQPEGPHSSRGPEPTAAANPRPQPSSTREGTVQPQNYNKPLHSCPKMIRLAGTLPHRFILAQKRPFSATSFRGNQSNLQIVTPPSVKYNRPIGGIRAGSVLQRSLLVLQRSLLWFIGFISWSYQFNPFES